MATYASRVCVLSEGEAEALAVGMPVNCALHEHVTSEEAFSLTSPLYQQRDGQANPVIAKWVGTKHIQYIMRFVLETSRYSLFWNARKRKAESISLKTRQIRARFVTESCQ